MLLGISGKIKSGKSTMAKYLCDKYGFVELSFAKPLKDISKILFNLSDEQLYNQTEKSIIDPRYNITPRKIMQILGTEIFRNELPKYIKLDLSIWIMIMDNNIKQLKKQNENINIVISDLRFENEYDWLKQNNGELINIIRPDLISNDTHESENALNTIDKINILNNMTDDFFNNIDLFMQKK